MFDILDIHNIHQGRSVSIYISLTSWKVVKLLGSPECHPMSLRGRWRFLRGVLVVFDTLDIHNIHQGRSLLIFRSIPSLKVVKLLGSPEHHPRSLRGRWRFLREVLVVFDIIDMLNILGHVIGERKKNIIYGECYLSAIVHKKLEFGL
jgi:hypothetical protein